MTTRLKSLMRRIAPATAGESANVHFHQGPQGSPAACHNPRCSAPHLSV